MVDMKLHLDPRLFILTYVVGIGLAIGVIAFALQVDEVVHVLGYEYGLQFDYEWATPYWMFLRLALGFVICLITLNAISAVLLFIQIHQTSAVKQKSTSRQPLQSLQPESSGIPSKEINEMKPLEKEENGIEVMTLPIVCNKCGKVFTQPLCMFDFKSGKPRLVNVCPYCNTILAVTGNSRSK